MARRRGSRSRAAVLCYHAWQRSAGHFQFRARNKAGLTLFRSRNKAGLTLFRSRNKAGLTLFRSLQERSGWFQNFAENFAQVGTTLGFLPAVVTQVSNDNEDFQFCASSALTVNAYAKAVRQYRQTVTEGGVGDPAPSFPVNPSLNPPNQVPTGIFERLDDLVKRIRVAPAYTPEIGALLGIIPASPARPPVNEMKPVVTVSEAVDPYSFTMKATRFGLSAYKVQIQRSGSINWVDNGFAQTNPHTVTISPTTAGQPERVLVRAVLMQNSEPVGIPSDPTYVTVNP